MHFRSTMGKVKYILNNVFWGLISAIWYKYTMFRSIPGCTYKESLLVLSGLIILLTALGIILTISIRRNDMNVFANVILPYEIYSVITFGKDLPILAGVSIGLSILLSIVCFISCLARAILNNAKRKYIIQRRLQFGLLGSKTAVSLCLLVFIIPVGINALLGGSLAFKKTDAEVPANRSNWTVSNCINVLSNLNQDKWDKMNLNEKADTLQTVANIESRYLGLPHELNVSISVLKDTVIAQYDDESHSITINITNLDTMEAAEILDSVCHESFHAYQHRLCDAYISLEPEYMNLIAFDSVPLYLEEFQDYENGINDAIGYYFQECEISARNYAEDRVLEYYANIELYTNNCSFIWFHYNGN